MLTANELTWLEKRGKHPYCQIWCMFDRNDDDCEWEQAAEYCPLVHGRKALIEAGQFEARVAAKLTKHIHNKPLVCEISWDCPYWPQGKCAWCYLKAARLEVEEEMNGKV